MVSPEKILIIDDDQKYRMLLCEELEDKGYEIVDTGNAEEALEVMECLRPNLNHTGCHDARHEWHGSSGAYRASATKAARHPSFIFGGK